MEKYSVLMSVYSKERPEYLKTSIDSMLCQTAPPDQFVIVKDGPLTTELEAVIRDFLVKNPYLFTIVELKENCGLGIALDEGLKHCRNEIIARMDADDISLPNRCERELHEFEYQPGISIVSGFVGEFEDDPNIIISLRKVPEHQNEIKKRMRTRSAFNHPAVMYKKSEVVRCGGYGTLRRKQDHVLFSHMISVGCTAYNIQDVILLFREDFSGRNRKKSSENIKCYIEAQKINYRRGECTFFDVIYVILTQTLVLLLPEQVVRILRKTFFRGR